MVTPERDCGDNIFTVEKPARRIANTYGGVDDPVYGANARLIAAAPDLLTACHNALDDLRTIFRNFKPETEWTEDDVTAGLVAAIAKAEGASSVSMP
jgi:hypothetical protein